MSKKLKPYFSYTFSGQIWRILADTSTNMIVAEIREGNRRQVNFAAIHQNRLLYESIVLPETWWVSAVALHDGKLLLQTYPDSQSPTAKGLLAIDVLSGKMVWQQPHLNFVQMTLNALVATEQTESLPVYYTLDLNTGVMTDTIEENKLSLLAKAQVPEILYPQQYTPENKYFNTIVSFLNKLLDIHPVKAFDYAEYQHLLVISYYLYTHNTLSNFLAVIDPQANVLLHQPIATQLSGIGLDTFFIINNHLTFVKEKTELISYEL